MKPKTLSREELLEVIDKTPLISIDLVIRDARNRILLGRKKTEPAAYEWLVPGGRILKNEALDEAFTRIAEAEIGQTCFIHQAQLINAFSHVYDTNILGVRGIATHSIALAYELHVGDDISIVNDDKFVEYRWFSREEADPQISTAADPDVNAYVLDYFRYPCSMDRSQYKILNARRDAVTKSLWQVSIVSLTAQAFLFSLALNDAVNVLGRTFAAALAVIMAMASLRILAFYKRKEMRYGDVLHAHERMHYPFALNRGLTLTSGPAGRSSYRVWRLLLWIFCWVGCVCVLFIWLGMFDLNAADIREWVVQHLRLTVAYLNQLLYWLLHRLSGL